MRRAALRPFLAVMMALLLAACALPAYSDKPTTQRDYSVLAPISSGSLTVYPVVSSRVYDTREFLTLDEGVRSGQVVVSETGSAQPLVRRPGMQPQQGSGAEVNRLVLINDSDRPLLLLAGEIVTGGKQDRVIGADRIVPPKSPGIDLSVFCVEPGRWVGGSDKFSSVNGAMAQPSVRMPAMAEKDQQAVWDNVAKSRQAMSENVEVTAQASIAGSTSYAKAVNNRAVQANIDKVAAPIEADYLSLRRKLREERATGVVVAINGHIVWADIFASPELLDAYWPKLVRSYAAEAVTNSYAGKVRGKESAESFLADMSGNREVAETEPNVFRRSELTGDGFKVFNIVSLLPKTNFAVHTAKMADVPVVARRGRPDMIR